MVYQCVVEDHGGQVSLTSDPDGGTRVIDEVTVAGAVGDEIWMVVEDGHPEWLTAERLVWTLPVIPGAPSVGLDGGDLAYFGGGYHLTAAAGVITDPEGRQAGLWYSPYSSTTIRFEPDNIMLVSLPSPASDPFLMDTGRHRR